MISASVRMSGRSEEANRDDAGESVNFCTFTTLSTVAVQAGQSQTVISVLKVRKDQKGVIFGSKDFGMVSGSD